MEAMKTNNPICIYDSKECSKYDSLDCRADCHNCDREFNGVRATGGMPMLEMIVNAIKKLLRMKPRKPLLAIATAIALFFAVKFLSIEKYTTETLLTAFLFLCVALGCVIAFGIESDKTNKPSKN